MCQTQQLSKTGFGLRSGAWRALSIFASPAGTLWPLRRHNFGERDGLKRQESAWKPIDLIVKFGKCIQCIHWMVHLSGFGHCQPNLSHALVEDVYTDWRSMLGHVDPLFRFLQAKIRQPWRQRRFHPGSLELAGCWPEQTFFEKCLRAAKHGHSRTH